MPGKTEYARQRVKHFADTLDKAEKMLVILRHELYEDSWDEMLADMKARLAGGPFVFKLTDRIEDDIERIEKLRNFEARWSVDLAECVSLFRNDDA